MRNVMEKAQELAQAIVESDIYQRMHTVENLLAEENMYHTALAEAGKAMEEAEAALNEQALVKELQAAREDFSQMMENVNRILRLVITGEPEDSGCGGGCSGCSGSCGSCSGCGE